MALEALPHSQDWRRPLGLAAAGAALGLVVRVAGGGLPAPAATIALGTGIVGASFLLSWAADAAEVDFSGGLVLAGVTLLTVLPELVIEVHFAYTRQTALVSANLTGATRLLLTGATAMPLLGAWLLARRGQRAGSLTLGPARRVDLAILFVAAIYGAVVALLGRVSVIDGLLLVALYLFFLRRVRGTPDEPPAVVGVSAGLAALPRGQRRPMLAGMGTLAAVAVAVVADPFVDALLETGTSVGIDRYLLVQSIIPAATETPEFVIAAVLALNRRPAQGLAVFLAASVAQWTFALGVLPLAYAAGGGGTALPLNTRSEAELALTVATTLMAVAALSSLAPKRFDSWIILTLYVIQFAFPETEVRVAVAVVLGLFTVDILVANRSAVRPMFAALWSRHPPDRARGD
jgi:cation:H+ antiporter